MRRVLVLLFLALLPLGGISAQGTPAACPGAPFVIPAAGVVGWSYRWPIGGGQLHTGLDIYGARGDPIYAAADGPVLAVDDRRIRIRHATLGVDTYYTHLERVHVRAGQYVTRGQLIGNMGDRGADVVHLHFSLTRVPPGAANWLWLDERYIDNTVDPSAYLRANVSYPTGATDHRQRTIQARCLIMVVQRTFMPLEPRGARP